MIPAATITEWAQQAPWPAVEQVEGAASRMVRRER